MSGKTGGYVRRAGITQMLPGARIDFDNEAAEKIRFNANFGLGVQSGELTLSAQTANALRFRRPGFNGSAVDVWHDGRVYASAEQTITASGALTLAHGLGATPRFLFAFIKCLTAELGYAVGDVVAINPHQQNNLNDGRRGHVLVADATNINVRFGQAAGVFSILRKDTGDSVNSITLANWSYIVRAIL